MAKPTVILHLRSTRTPEPFDGANRVIYEISKAMNHSKYINILVFLLNKDMKANQTFNPNNGNNLVESHVMSSSRYIDFNIIKCLSHIIKKRNVDIVHSCDYKSNIFTLILKRMHPKIKIVTTIHGYVANTFKGHFYCMTDKLLVGFFDAIIVVASSMRNQLHPLYRRKIVVIHNGIDTNFWAPMPRFDKNSSGKIIVGFSGRISQEKGWKEFCQVAAQTSKQLHNIFFLVAGDGQDRFKMEHTASQLGLNKHISFMGFIENMKQFYSQIDILLAPSRTEGLPMAQLEANAMGIPVVATKVGGVEDLIIHEYNGLLSSAGDIENLSESLLRLAKDTHLRLSLGNNGKTRVFQHFSISVQVQKLEQLYDLLILNKFPSS